MRGSILITRVRATRGYATLVTRGTSPGPPQRLPWPVFQRTGSRRLLGSEAPRVKECTRIGSRSRPQRNNLIFKINFKKKTNLVLVSKRVHPRFRTLTTGFLSEDFVSGPQRRVFFLGTSFHVRLEVWTGY
jgi:hypothetical protein